AVVAGAYVRGLSIALRGRAGRLAGQSTLAVSVERSRHRNVWRWRSPFEIMWRRGAIACRLRPRAGVLPLTTVELRARIAMSAAGPPVAAALLLRPIGVA